MHTCPVEGCDYSSARTGNVDRHLRTEHSYDESAISALREERKKTRETVRLEREESLPIQCPHCPSRLLNPHSLRQHLRQKHPDSITVNDVSESLQDARIGLGDAIDLEHDYNNAPPLEPLWQAEDDIPLQFRDDEMDDEERERRRKEREEEDERRDMKNKYRTLCLEVLNKATASVGKCMREDEDEKRLKALYDGIIQTLEGINIPVDQAAVRGERLKKRQGVKGSNLLDRETRGDIKRRRRAEMELPKGFPRRDPSENTVCVKCKRAEPREETMDDEDINWVACSKTDCGLYYHEVCVPLGSLCVCRDGYMIYKEID